MGIQLREHAQITFRDPENPSDSVKKYANGIRINRAKFEHKNIWFHSPEIKRNVIICIIKYATNSPVVSLLKRKFH